MERLITKEKDEATLRERKRSLRRSCVSVSRSVYSVSTVDEEI